MQLEHWTCPFPWSVLIPGSHPHFLETNRPVFLGTTQTRCHSTKFGTSWNPKYGRIVDDCLSEFMWVCVCGKLGTEDMEGMFLSVACPKFRTPKRKRNYHGPFTIRCHQTWYAGEKNWTISHLVQWFSQIETSNLFRDVQLIVWLPEGASCLSVVWGSTGSRWFPVLVIAIESWQIGHLFIIYP